MARGIALLGMFVAHTAPGAGPGGVLMVSEYFPFPLFVLLLGAGAEFVGRRTGLLRHGVESTVRAACLVAIGWGLTQADAQVFVVLGAMAVAMAAAWLMAALPNVVLVIAAAAGFATTTAWNTALNDWRLDLVQAGDLTGLEWVNLVLSPAYPAPFVLACAALGVVGARLLHPRSGPGPSSMVLLTASALLLAAGGALLLLHRTGHLEAGADSFGWPTTIASLAMAFGVWAASAWAVRPAPVLTTAFHAVGTMSLTLYSLHVLWLGYWVQVLHPGERDDHWVNVIGMSVAAIVLALGWRALRLGGRWWRGPLEGVVGTAARVAGRLVPDRSAVSQ